MAVLAAAAGVAAHPEWPAASQELLRSARLWESRQRGDLAQLALKKLVASRPDSPEALEELGELDLRIGDFTDAAQVAGQLEQRFAGTPAARGFAVEYRIATRERVQLAAIHRLVAIHRSGEVRAALERLFPDGAPSDTLGIEYYQLLACTPRGWALASIGLEHLAALHPDDPRYQFALVRHLLERPQDAAAASQILRRLARRDDVLPSEVDELLALAQRESGRPALPPTVSKRPCKRRGGSNGAACRWPTAWRGARPQSPMPPRRSGGANSSPRSLCRSPLMRRAPPRRPASCWRRRRRSILVRTGYSKPTCVG
jgi:hypothetical protein